MTRINTDNRISVLANQLLTPNLASGGDVLSFEIIAKFPDTNLNIFIPGIALHNISLLFDKQCVISTDKSKMVPGSGIFGGISIILLYLLRTIKTISLLQKTDRVDKIYLTGDFFCNSVPAVIYKIFHPKTKIYCNFYHLNPVPWKRENNLVFSTVSWILQHFSLAIMKPFIDHFFVLTKEGKDILAKLGFNQNKILISGAGVSNKYLDKSIVGKSPFDLLFVGRLNQTKGIYDALKVMKNLIIKNPQIKLGVIGSSTPGDLQKIDRLIVKYKIKMNVECLGYVSDIKKIKLMKGTPVLLAPSHEEGFGIGVLEGIASGMKVVAYDLPVYKLIFGKYKTNICYAPVGDTNTLAKKVIQLLKKKKFKNSPQIVPTWDDIAKIQSKIINQDS